VATGPLTSPAMSAALAEAAGRENLFFYDAIAPVVEADSLDRSIVFSASRYDRGESAAGDYLNCPLSREEYDRFVEALIAARRMELKPFEATIDLGVRAGSYFEGCLPVEVLAARGPRTLAFGPMRPVGLRDPRTGYRPHAVLQLRCENRTATQYNLVGFQTNLAQGEQERVFRMIPGLQQARFARYGQMHRNTYLRTPGLLTPALEWIGREGLFLAGQLAGVEGYMGSVATGWLAGVNATRRAEGRSPVTLSPETMLGALCLHVAEAEAEGYQPVKANLGILPPLADPGLRGKEKAAALSARARAALPTDL
jgi:methylenetetrahydrofolate--tRNA-(uracil-5-)-methyltransferase